jgi:glycosyltransferase involved in cell wall biosynthesis/2-polyprenyl-3-methyl-5-hydroxy-6-metoxy-1,4-benzoquinol methylase
MKILFVNYENFRSNSAVHIFNLAERLTASGDSCAACVPTGKKTIRAIREPSFAILDYTEARRGQYGYPDNGPPDVIHAWTPREGVRKLTTELAARHSAPYFVHLEDNEDVIAADYMGVARDELRGMPRAVLDSWATDGVAHPFRAREFLAGAAGVTVIVDRLREFVPSDVPAIELWPAFEDELFRPQPPSPALRASLGIDREHVVVYAGNVHQTNAAEVRSLYLAIALVNRRNVPVKLVRLGRDFAEYLKSEAPLVTKHVVRVDFRPRVEVPLYYALADVLVQPGRPGDFNDYRIPSKLPEFFAMGRPVVLPPTNVGMVARDGEECVLLEEGDAMDIATKLEDLLGDAARRARIGEGGRRFAERNFSWAQSAKLLRGFYAAVTARAHATPIAAIPRTVLDRYASFQPAALGYATVRDYCDSTDTFPALATLSGDLKDVQRPWMLKAVVGCVQPGGRLLEIGAGDPHVADLLAGLGYAVTVVDPYDGRDGGPTAFEAISEKHPRIRFVRGVFPDTLAGEGYGSFDCIYSISVLEHIPAEAIDRVWEGIEEHATPGGISIHAIDHVLRGNGAPEHHANLLHVVQRAGLTRSDLDAVLAKLEDDPETYFLSAEGHNRWRGQVPYDEFPMRRCVSVQVCVPVARLAGTQNP